jgi:hypothetical protein
VCISLKGKFVSDVSRQVRACPDDTEFAVSVFLLTSEMGYLGYFYVKAKHFAILSKVGSGVRFADESRGVYRVVILGKPSRC